MPTLAIVGAGALGGTLAFTLAGHDRYREVRLIDADAPDLAAGVALDIAQAGPIERFRTRVVAASPAGVADADLVVLAGSSRNPDSADPGRTELASLRQVARVNRRAPILCAGGDQAELMERGVTEVGIDRRRLIGSAPEAWRAAVRAMVALELECAPSEVALAILGRPPSNPVVPWSHASVAGIGLETLLSPPRLARVEQRVDRLWPLGPYALAAGAARVAACLTGGQPRRPCCLIVMDGEYGVRRRALSSPVELDPHGMTRVLEPRVTPRERARLDT